MRHPELKSYRFDQPAHWRAGAFSNLDVTENGLQAPEQLTFQPIAGTGCTDDALALAFDACGRLYWLRSATAELWRLYSFGPQLVGRLLDAEGATALVVGAARLWALTRGGVNSYARRDLQLLWRLKSDRHVLDLAGDGADGVWLLLGGNAEPAELIHYDRMACREPDRITLPQPIVDGALGASRSGRALVVLDRERERHHNQSNSNGTEEAGWRLLLINPATGEIQTRTHEELSADDPRFRPHLVAVDAEDGVHLMDRGASGRFKLWTVSLTGELLAQQVLAVPWDSITAIAAATDIVIAGPGGLAILGPDTNAHREGQGSTSVFITPTLVSPEEATRGWLRADIDVMLPEGVTLAVTLAATRSTSIINAANRILNDPRLLPAAKLEKLDKLNLPWRDRVVYAGSEPAGARTRVRYALHEVQDTHLWLRFTLYTPPSREPPVLSALTVNYPNLSLIRYLPATYQEEPTSAAQLRRFLAPSESQLGDLDAVIDGLHRNIDPETAPASWLPFLMRWLGLPSPIGLVEEVQRSLLLAAPDLLAKRGTLDALRCVLRLIAQAPVIVRDIAAGPAPWVLPAGEHGTVQSRLGRDTLITAQDPPSFRSGRTARLGATPLGNGCPMPARLFQNRTGVLQIAIGIGKAERARLEPVIRRFLSHFVPAHCRYRLTFVPPARWRRVRRLDVDLRLAGDNASRLGDDTVLGKLKLPALPTDGPFLGRTTFLDCRLQLT